MPVHVATVGASRVDIEVTSMSKSGRRTTVRRNQSAIRDPRSEMATIRIAVP
jgi:hypothetical protein